ncbi:BTB/POZ protein [Rhizophagus irregularis DAOM 181602=DAOM 197198]|nr:BTB/POZ protein [Rhizophagus irregularis DAOM 181602=DAOM 197198]
MSTVFLSKLSQNYIELLTDNKYCDVTNEVGEDPNVKILRAHVNILCCRSPYLRRTLASNKKIKNNGLTHIELPNISPEIFQIILKYIYGDFMLKSPEKIFKSLDVTLLPEKTLVQVIQRDDLQMKEVKVWERVLKWGLAQNPKIFSDPNTWSNDDFKTMKNTLKNCLPFINFFNSSPKDFQLVRPYEKLLKLRLYEELLNSHLVSNIKGKDEIIGGYNPLVWKSSGSWGLTKHSFIFSFKGNDINSLIISNIVNAECALNHGVYRGPCFGQDIVIYSRNGEFQNYNYNYCEKCYYGKQIRDTKYQFTIEDYEVFKIMV